MPKSVFERYSNGNFRFFSDVFTSAAELGQVLVFQKHVAIYELDLIKVN